MTRKFEVTIELTDSDSKILGKAIDLQDYMEDELCNVLESDFDLNVVELKAE